MERRQNIQYAFCDKTNQGKEAEEIKKAEIMTPPT